MSTVPASSSVMVSIRSDPLQPEALGRGRHHVCLDEARAQRHRALEAIAVKAFEERVEQLDFECLVVLQERADQIRLVPATSLVHPLPGVLEREEDIVHVDINAGWQ